MTLGSIISKYKYKRGRGQISDHDIDQIISRLEGYRKFKQKQKQERFVKKRSATRTLKRKLKKANYRKMYSYKAVNNPYISMYNKLRPSVDPKLLERYHSTNIYMLYEFRTLKLPRSGYTLTAGKAWHALTDAWTGYKIAKRYKDSDLELKYANAVQKFAYYLQVPKMPSFEGLPSYDFKLDLEKKYNENN